MLPNIHSEDGDLALSYGEASANSFVHNQLAGECICMCMGIRCVCMDCICVYGYTHDTVLGLF